MTYLTICLAAFVTSLFTFFSGFGLGTLLMPVFAVFFPVELAIALTAVVHLLNNLFKAFLIGRRADKKIVIQFGLPAMLAAFLGAKVLVWLANLPPLMVYSFSGTEHAVTLVKLVTALLMIVFAVLEYFPAQVQGNFLWLGGLLSGFFGGLSGHQGAFRSAFLVKLGLSKEGFIGTNVLIACLVDISRLFVYSHSLRPDILDENTAILVAAAFSAFLGAWLGNRLLKKVTMGGVQKLVMVLLFLIAIGLGSGLL